MSPGIIDRRQRLIYFLLRTCKIMENKHRLKSSLRLVHDKLPKNLPLPADRNHEVKDV